VDQKPTNIVKNVQREKWFAVTISAIFCASETTAATLWPQYKQNKTTLLNALQQDLWHPQRHLKRIFKRMCTCASASLKYPKHDNHVVQVALDASRTGARIYARLAYIASHERHNRPNKRRQRHVNSVTKIAKS
jgi:hypothetical protein